MAWRLLAWLMNQVRINNVRPILSDRPPAFQKRRRTGAGIIVWCASKFLALTHSGISMFAHGNEWILWELHCAALLYPQRPHPTRGPACSILMPAFPGKSLRRLLREKQVDAPALIATAREIRRVHQLPCGIFHQAWSHGDLHLDNIIYDPHTNTAALIDFDTRHLPRLDATWRHADDLKAFLLEYLASAGDDWAPGAAAFLREYGHPPVLHELLPQLAIPTGLARILWYTRIYGAPLNRIEPRLLELRIMIQQLISAD